MAGMDPFYLIFLKLTITGSLVASQQQTKEALDLAARGFIKPRITVMPFKKFPEGMKLLVSNGLYLWKESWSLTVSFAS